MQIDEKAFSIAWQEHYGKYKLTTDEKKREERFLKTYLQAADGWIKLEAPHQYIEEEMIGCIYKNGVYGTPFAVIHNEDKERYECLLLTEAYEHIPTHVRKMPNPPEDKE